MNEYFSVALERIGDGRHRDGVLRLAGAANEDKKTSRHSFCGPFLSRTYAAYLGQNVLPVLAMMLCWGGDFFSAGDIFGKYFSRHIYRDEGWVVPVIAMALLAELLFAS